MTLVVLEKHRKVSMSLKYLGTMLIVFFVMNIGYFVFPPHLEMSDYALGIVNTHTDQALQIFVNAIRLLFATYATIRYNIITRKIEGETKNRTKNRMKWFSFGLIIMILGLTTNLAGGLFSSILLEILALVIIDIGAFLVLKGFLI